MASEYSKKVEECLSVREENCNSVQDMWMVLKECLVSVAENVCGLRKCGGGKKGNAWWNDEVKEVVREKNVRWRRVLQARNGSDEKERLIEEYKVAKRRVKRKVCESKRKANEEFGRKVNGAFVDNRKLFWKAVRNCKSQGGKGLSSVKDRNGNIINDSMAVKERWQEYFSDLLPGEDKRI